MQSLQAWSSRKSGNILRELEAVRSEVNNLLLHGADSKEVRQISDKLNELLYKEEMLWLQWSRVSRLKEGDRNTKFFHRKPVWRAKKNKIVKLQKADGSWVSSQTELERMTTQFFQDLFSQDPNLNPSDIVNLFEKKVSEDMNEALCKDFSDKEISDALF